MEYRNLVEIDGMFKEVRHSETKFCDFWHRRLSVSMDFVDTFYNFGSPRSRSGWPWQNSSTATTSMFSAPTGNPG